MSKPKLVEGKWYWVRCRGSRVWFPAFRYSHASNGWSNQDTWEDFDHEVIDWRHIPEPKDLKIIDGEVSNG